MVRPCAYRGQIRLKHRKCPPHTRWSRDRCLVIESQRDNAQREANRRWNRLSKSKRNALILEEYKVTQYGWGDNPDIEDALAWWEFRNPVFKDETKLANYVWGRI